MTRAAKSGEPAASSGTAMTPRRRQPKKAAIHSAEFSPQRRTRSPGAMARRSSSAAKRPASCGEFAVGGGVAAVAAMGDDGGLRWVQAEVFDETGEVRAHAPMIAAAAGLASKSADGFGFWVASGEDGRSLRSMPMLSHLGDDEAVAKMGHPVLGSWAQFLVKKV